MACKTIVKKDPTFWVVVNINKAAIYVKLPILEVNGPAWDSWRFPVSVWKGVFWFQLSTNYTTLLCKADSEKS